MLRTLACVVYHFGLIEQMNRVPGHDFNQLSILHDRPFLQELKAMVTLEPTEGVMTERTGIPPHVSQDLVESYFPSFHLLV